MKHVLIVEDHEENRNLLKLLLEVNGYRVTGAGDGLEALAAARRDPPDAVVSDALMPNMDGFELCRAWMQDAALKPIPFIFYSATYVQGDDEKFALALGAVRYLIKPLQAEAFLAELRAVLQDWTGRPAPVLAAPLDDAATHVLHESALARKLEDKIAQLEAAKRKLEESEQRFRNLTEMSLDFYWESDAEHRLARRTSAAKKTSAVSVFERGLQVGERRWDIPYLSPDAAGWAAHRATLDAHQPFRHFELSRLGTDRTEHFISISGDPLFDASGAFAGYRGVGTDITERKLAGRQIERINRMYAMLSHANEVLVRARSEEALYADMCHVAVERGGMLGAVVRIIDVEAKILRHVAYAGPIGKVVADLVCSTDPARPESQTSASIAFRENRIVIRNELPEDDTVMPWKPLVMASGIYSFAAVPLRRSGKPIGVFMLNAAEAGYFDEEMTALLDRLLADVAYALDNLEYERQRKRTERELVESEDRFRSLVEQSLVGIFMTDGVHVLYANPRAEQIVGYAAGELAGRSILPLVVDADRPATEAEIRSLLAGERSVGTLDFRALRKDGSEVTIGAQGMRARFDNRPAIVVVMQDISEKKRAEEQIRQYVVQLESAFMSTVEVATTLGEMRDPYTGGHQRKVAQIAVAIGAELGFDAHRQEGLRVAGYLHDIGKIRIPSEILSKPGKLSATEYQLVQGHAQASYDVLKGVEFPWPVAEVALQHHERMDGSGYPQGLKGNAIRFEARIMAVADVVEAMSSHRPYRPGLGIDKALAEIERGRGSAYDADVADACLRLFRERQYQLPG